MDAFDNSRVKGPIFGAQTQAAAHNTFVFRPRKAREEAIFFDRLLSIMGRRLIEGLLINSKPKGGTLLHKRWSSAPCFSAWNLKNGMMIEVHGGNQRPA
jgi:hypothetical protein